MCAVAAPASGGSLWIDVSQERISVHAEAVDLATLLGEISRRTGVAFTGAESLAREVSVTFARLTVEEALPLLLRDTSYVLVLEQPHGVGPPALSEVVIVADDPPAERRPLAEPAGQGQGLRSLQALALDDPQTALPRLQEALKMAGPTARMQLLDVVATIDHPGKTTVLREALADPDAKVRFFAVDLLSSLDDGASLVGPALADADPEVRLLAERIVEMSRQHAAAAR